MNRESIGELPLLRTLLAIRQKSRELSFWEVMVSFVLLSYAGLAASRTLLQQLLACLKFTLDSEYLLCWYKQNKNDFYKIWQQHKQLNPMEVSEAWPDTYVEGYIPQFQPEALSLKISAHGISLK